MATRIEYIPYKGWKNNVRLSNGVVDVVLTQDVGPRIIRFGFVGERNVFAEMPKQVGRSGEKKWMLRGGHRLWIAPEETPKTYELDNGPVAAKRIAGGVRAIQETGPLSGVQKMLDITLEGKSGVRVGHTLVNRGRRSARLAPWALTVMAPGGMAVIPLPEKILHTDRLTHNQEWSLWGYTDFADGRWTLGSRYVFFRQNRRRGPGKIGIAHREGWVGYLLGPYLFVKKFKRIEGKVYPDGGVNFETFSNEDFLEVETLGPLVDLKPGHSIRHEERWQLFKGVPKITTEADADRLARRLR